MEEGPTTFSRQESLQKVESGGSKFLWLLIIVVIVALAGGGIYFFQFRQNNSEEITTLMPTPTYYPTPTATPTPELTITPTPTSAKAKSTPTPTPRVTPTPTPKSGQTSQRVATTAAELKRQAITVQVLNGTGVPGVAQKAADYLAGFFYTISNVGNAENYNYDKTVIQTKSAADLELLTADLAAQYEIGTASATLPSASTYDAVVTIGKK